jgi:hypothetical protein
VKTVPLETAGKERRVLYIVARDEQTLFQGLTKDFSGIDVVGVVLDRRVGARRRQQPEPPVSDRRKGDRRTRAPLDQRLRLFGYAVVRTRGGERAKSPAR